MALWALSARAMNRLVFSTCSTIGNGVSVRESGIPVAGNGVFCSLKNGFRKNDVITEYAGDVQEALCSSLKVYTSL
jgi:hypothetical protein